MLAMGSRLWRVLFLVLALGATSALLFADQTFRLQSVRMTGSHRFREEDLVAASGLKPGATVDLAALKNAADHLMQTGAIANLQYKYTPLSNGLLVEYTVTDGADFLPCRYDNIVWLSKDDLIKAVHQKVPLFSGEAPTTGELLDQVAQAISDILAQHGIVTKVRYELHSQGVGGPIDAVSFVSETLKPKVQEITLAGATLLSAQEKLDNAKRLIGEDYNATSLRESLVNGLFFVYGNKGYLRMQVGEPEAKIMGDAQQGTVAVSVPVTEGLQYRWKSITWSGNTAIPTAELEKTVTFRAGDVADHSKLDMGLAEVQRTYGTRGYLAAKLQRVPTFNDDDRSVSYEIKVREGDVFHMGTLRITGLDSAVLDELQKKWTMHRGDVFNQQYIQAFLKDKDNAALINSGRKAKAIKVLQSPTPDKLVDVTLQF
jgi:outer membrane protein insertion porin family